MVRARVDPGVLVQSRSKWMVGSVAQSCPTPLTPWTVARQASLSVGFPRQENWSGAGAKGSTKDSSFLFHNFNCSVGFILYEHNMRIFLSLIC